MVSITTSRDATMLQLQYDAESIGLRRSYLSTTPKEPNISKWEEVIASEVTLDESQPDIAWNPSYQTYQDRVERLSSLRASRPGALPEGFPKVIQSSRVWAGSDFHDAEKYIVRLSDANIAEIEKALTYFKALPGDNGPEEVSQKTFPLPGMEKMLAEIAVDLHSGKGFVVLRGLNPTKYSPLDNVLLYLGVTSHIAEIRGCQDYDGRMIVHIQDMERDLPEATGRPSPYTSRAQPFHTDRCDILSMYALDVAAIGGESLLASSARIYNEIAETRPDVLHVLADNKWIFDEFIKPASWHSRPLMYNFKEHGPSFVYSRRPLTGAPFSPHVSGVPPMTEIQAEALDMVHFIAEKHQLCIKLEQGDIQIFNNLAMFHARKGFVDDGLQKRHFLRLWLKNARLAWARPEALKLQAAELYEKSALKANVRWDISRAPSVPRVITRHMACS